MKRMMMASMLAVALVAANQQEASAWCKFNFSCGLNISYESTGSNWNFCGSHVPNPPPCGYGYSCAPSCDYGAYSYAAPAAAAPATAYNYAPAAPRAQTQQVGYYYYGQNQGYAPSYWYGY